MSTKAFFIVKDFFAAVARAGGHGSGGITGGVLTVLFHLELILVTAVLDSVQEARIQVGEEQIRIKQVILQLGSAGILKDKTEK
jgi:hypothetical protein